jgi:hypothetical protein
MAHDSTTMRPKDTKTYDPSSISMKVDPTAHEKHENVTPKDIKSEYDSEGMCVEG